MKPSLISILLVVCISVFSCQTKNDKVIQLKPKEFNQFLKSNPQLIDVRTPKEFNLEHIVNAQNKNYFAEDFSTLIEELDKEQPVFIYCRSGKRSGKSISKFLNAGFTNIYELEGGILNWKDKGFKTTKK